MKAEESVFEIQKRLIDIFENNKSSVVRVLAGVPSLDDDHHVLQIGTGFFISQEGHILTNANVVENAEILYIEHNYLSYPAKLIGKDPITNICVLKALMDDTTITHLNLTDNDSKLPIASILFSITCEMGLDPGPSWGLLTGYNLYYGDKTLPTTYIRSDIPSDGGEGGSPVFDLNGRFIGMIVASLIDIRSSFIIPAKALIRIRDDILFSGKVHYGYLGIKIDESKLMLGDHPLVIEHVQPESPAALAGIEPNDHLLKVGNAPIKHLADLHNASFYSRPGQFIDLEVSREGRKMVLSLKVGEQPIASSPKENIDHSKSSNTVPLVSPDHKPDSEAIH